MHLEPDPQLWLDAERLSRFRGAFLPLSSTLAMAGLLVGSLDHWLRLEIADEAPWPEGERERLAAERTADWICRHASDPVTLTAPELLRRLTVKQGCRLWAAQQWSQQREALFLAHKNSLDRASCWLLQVSDRDLAQELSYRLQAGEESFEAVASRYSEGKERQYGGHYPLQPLSRFPMGLGNLLQQLTPGEVTPPLPLGERWAVVQLEQHQPASLDPDRLPELYDCALNEWIKATIACLLSALRTSDERQLTPSS